MQDRTEAGRGAFCPEQFAGAAFPGTARSTRQGFRARSHGVWGTHGGGGGTHAESPPPLPEACGPPARTWSLTEVSGLRCATGPSETLAVCELSFWGAGGGTSLRSHETLRIISGHSGERTGFLFKP